MPMYNGSSATPFERPKATAVPPTERGAERTTSVGEEEAQTSPTVIYNPFFTGRPRTPSNMIKKESVNRQEIIRRIKEGESVRQNEVSTPLEQTSPTVAASRKRKSPSPPPLLPSPELGCQGEHQRKSSDDLVTLGMAISRPRSALHKGDFRGGQGSTTDSGEIPLCGEVLSFARQQTYSTSPVAPWHRNFPLAASRHIGRPNDSSIAHPVGGSMRPRAVSQASISGSFTYQPPTSPLVHQANAADIPEIEHLRSQSRSPERNRRHTFSPRSLQNVLDASHSMVVWSPSSPSLVPKENMSPYQAHQPRRSITSASSVPQTPLNGGRRPSLSSGSPLQRPMVGSFEESILRGRMSSTPSKPLDFTAQIGVLGRGDCKPCLRCPPHITIAFPAVFYSYGPSSHIAAESQPSPYVGLVDLENCPETHLPRERSRYRPTRLHSCDDRSTGRSRATNSADHVASDVDARKRRKQKQKKQSESPLQAPKGGYRIPAVGQLQIIIKNPHKTAVKLFLVPYDVSDIQPGQKSFIRQRSYSAGPILDIPLDARKNLGTDRPEAAICVTEDPKDKPVLRYLIHLHICCPSKGRIYLYNSIRVVFANRVPDGKEKLRNEIQLPSPRYSVYKPSRESNAGLGTDLSTFQQRRRSVIEIDPAIAYGTPTLPTLQSSTTEPIASSFPFTGAYADFPGHRLTAPSFQFPRLDTVNSRPTSRGASDEMDFDAGDMTWPIAPASPMSPSLQVRSAGSEVSATTQNGGRPSMTFSRSNSQERPALRAESLLSRRLKDLEMRGQNGGPAEPLP